MPADASHREHEEMNNMRFELNKKIIELLRPEVTKLKDFMNYANETILHFKTTVEKFASANTGISEGISVALINLIDVLLKLDNLKDS